jgi:hypothetical protein
MELMTSSTPFFGSGMATTVSSSSTCVVHTRGGGGALRDGWGLAGVAPARLGFFGQCLDMCPCCLQKKHHPSAISRHFSSSLRGFRVLMASTSIDLGRERKSFLLVRVVQSIAAIDSLSLGSPDFPLTVGRRG